MRMEKAELGGVLLFISYQNKASAFAYTISVLHFINVHCAACFDSTSSANTMYEMLHSTPSIMLIKVKPQILVLLQ